MAINELPKILKEDIPADHILACQKCELHKQSTRVIWGEGNPNAPILVILDNPGAREDKFGEPFLCGTRETLQKAAYEAGIYSDQLYITYILKCRPRRSYDKPNTRKICLNYLLEQINKINPRIIIILGNVAAQCFFDQPEIEVKTIRGHIHNIKGYKTAASYHPLAVRRRPALYKFFLQDWQLVAANLIKIK